MKKAAKTENCNKPLRSNPFTCHRDPHTGRWVVVESQAKETKSDRKLVSTAA